MSTTTNYLITGANRGIGGGLVKVYLSRPNSVVVAAVRDTFSPSSEALFRLPRGDGSSLFVVKLDNLSETDAKEVVEELKTDHGIDRLDIVIANAGIAKNWDTAYNVAIDEVRDHFNVNTIGSLVLFQATWPILQKSSNPKFVYVSSTVGSIGDMEKWPLQAVAYGASKAAMNYISRKMHLENEKLTVFPLHPGWVQTDMGNAGANEHGMTEAPVTLEECVSGMVSKIDSSSRKETSGTFVSFDGAHVNW